MALFFTSCEFLLKGLLGEALIFILVKNRSIYSEFRDNSYPTSSHLPLAFPSIRVFSTESALHIRWPKDWSFSFISISPSSEYSGLRVAEE